jgi:hypothetical protein
VNYQKIYDQIINKAKSENRLKGRGMYYEKHHIMPRCLGGSDNKSNLVLLTAREHFICHWILTRLYPNNRGIIHALWGMCNKMSSQNQIRYVPSSRVYEEARQLHDLSISKIMSEHKKNKKRTPFSDEWKRKIGDGSKGRKWSEESKMKFSQSKTRQVLDLLTGDVYESRIILAQKLNCTPDNIYHLIKKGSYKYIEKINNDTN